MKNHLLIVLSVMLFVSCKNGGETGNESYPRAVVGINNNGVYEISDLPLIKKNWESQIDDSEGKITLEAFEIVKGTTEGESVEDFYILIARSDDGTLKSSALLELRDNKFYFEKQSRPNSDDVFLNIVCKGNCDQGCFPAVKVVNGGRQLVCSNCPDCMKVENEMQKASVAIN